MIHYRKILELQDEGISMRGISSSTGNSRQKVTEIIELAKKKGLICPLDEEMDDKWIEEFLFPEKSLEAFGRQPLDFEYIHKELAKPNVTLSLLHYGALIPIQDSLLNLSILMKDVEKEDPKTTFILQPSYPIYGTKTYPIQVAELKNYASENSITILNHWSAWPEEDLKNNILTDQNGPTEKGNEIWEKFIEDYLIRK